MDHAPDEEQHDEGWRDGLRRLRWRLKGAWQLPLFVGCTLIETVLLSLLPLSGPHPGALGQFLLAGIANLLVMAVLAAPGGWLLRRWRPSLPKAVATDRAGSALLVGLLGLLLVLGILHHPAVVEADRTEDRGLAAARGFLHGQADGFNYSPRRPNVLALSADLDRTCFPGLDPERWLCLFVDTTVTPPKVTRDPDQRPNSRYRVG